MNDTLEIHKSNLLMALNLAIKDQERVEKDAGFTVVSSFLAGLRATYAHIQSGGQIYIKGE